MEPRSYCFTDACRAAGMAGDRLSLAVCRGLLPCLDGHGRGRRFSPADIAAAAIYDRLTACGVTPARASRLAAGAVEPLREGGTIPREAILAVSPQPDGFRHAAPLLGTCWRNSAPLRHVLGIPKHPDPAMDYATGDGLDGHEAMVLVNVGQIAAAVSRRLAEIDREDDPAVLIEQMIG